VAEVNAKKTRFGREDALGMARAASDLYVAKGKKVVHLDLENDEHDDDEIAKLMLGPTGNLRAPTLKIGKKLLVGFNGEVYAELLG
jgi:arsenate reductase-like glutaredoxin family protein